MTLSVLQNKSQIASARAQLIERGLSAIESRGARLIKRLGLVRGVAVGDFVKSWDVEATLSFLQAHVASDAPIADIGCFASEILVSLHKAGYRNLTGIDLNPRVGEMPFARSIRYIRSDFTQTPLAPESFQAMTSISVIEHGYDPERLLAEVSRLLRPGGYFMASFDYWPEKIDTDGATFFGMPWLIFDRGDVGRLVDTAARHGLSPVGELAYDATDRPIECADRKYTFGHLVLKKA